MATLFEAIPFAVETSLFGVEAGKDEDSIIISNKKGFINTVKLSDCKLLTSLPIRHGVQVTSPAVWNNVREEYLLVQNKQEIRLWQDGIKNLDKAKRRHVSTNIHKLFCLPNFNPIILYEDGHTEFLGNVKPDQEPLLKQGEIITWCSTVTIAEGVCVLYTTSVKHENRLCVYSFWYSLDTQRWHQKTSTVLSHGALSGCACTAEPDQKAVRFFSLWSDGTLKETLLTESSQEEDIQSAVIPGIKAGCSLVCLSKDHVVIVGLQKDEQDGIGILDAKFGTLQAWQPLPPSFTSSKQVFCLQNHIFVHGGKVLCMYRYECHSSTLAVILGQQTETVNTIESCPTYISLAEWKTSESQQVSGSVGSEVLDFFRSLIDPSQTSTYTTFKEVFCKVTDILQEGLKDWAATSAVSLLILRCCSETNFWPRAEIELLVSQKCITSSNVGILFDALVKRKEVALIHKALKLLDEVPESCLIKALHCIMTTSDEALAHAVDGIEAEKTFDKDIMDECPLSEPKQHFVNLILCCPFSDIYLQESLCKLPFSVVLDFLKYILFLMKLPMKTSSDAKGPSSEKVYDWLAVTIDAHFTHLSLAKDAQELVAQLRDEVMIQVGTDTSNDVHMRQKSEVLSVNYYRLK
ncbi:hypothetical protein C0Q70_00671 [Pomacea canaliculata]|uniref:Nucleolar protein 11 n=1 Tax=Pomacea canaliculata TaxID=400727 RepID=A0A2T7PXA1_POMCA|nr:hypothetical protein C0Q70_00671 [Pomacea canaliculata]